MTSVKDFYKNGFPLHSKVMVLFAYREIHQTYYCDSEFDPSTTQFYKVVQKLMRCELLPGI